MKAAWTTLSGNGRGRIVLVVAIGWFAVLGIRFVIPAVLSQITAEFDLSNAVAGSAITLIWAMYAAVQLPAGSLVDRFGDRTVLVASLVVVAGSLVLFSVLSVLAIFLVACALLGLGSGLYGPPRATVISNTFTENDGIAFGFVLASGSVGAAIMPFIGTLVTVRHGWRLGLAVFVPGFLLVALGVWRSIPKRSAPTVAPRDRNLRDRATAVRAAVTQRAVTLAVGAMVIMLFGYQAITAFFPTYLIATKAVSHSTAGALFALLFASAAGFRFVAGGAADKFGFERTLTVIAIVSIPPLIALPFIDGLLPLAIIAALLGFQSGFGPVSEAYILRILPAAIQGTAWGLVRTLFFALGSTGSIFVGTLADHGYFDHAFFALAALSGIAALMYAFLPARDATQPQSLMR